MNDLNIVFNFIVEKIKSKNITLTELNDPKISEHFASEVFHFMFKDESKIIFNLNHEHELENMTLQEAKENQELFNYNDFYDGVKTNILLNARLYLSKDRTDPVWFLFEHGLFQITGKLNCSNCGISASFYFNYTEQKITTIRYEVNIDNEKIPCLKIPKIFSFSMKIPSRKLVILTEFEDLIQNIKRRDDFFENSISYPHGKMQECKHYLKNKIGYINSVGCMDHLIKQSDDCYLVSAESKGNVIAKLEKEMWGICLMDHYKFTSLCKKNGLTESDFSITCLTIPNKKIRVEYDLNKLDFYIHFE